MLNRREFLAAAVATSGASALAAGQQAQEQSSQLADRYLRDIEGLNSHPAEVQPAPLPPGSVKLGGELGRRMTITINNNLLALDAEQDFLKPLRERSWTGGYVGLGKLIDASARFALSTGDQRVQTLERHLVAETLKTQEKDGYIGYCAPAHRVWDLWDISEMGYIVYGLAMDHRFYNEAASLEGARKLADYIITRWSAEPNRRIGDIDIPSRMAAVGLENAMLALHQETKEEKYLAFVRDFRKIGDWDGQIVLGRWGRIEGHAYTYLAECIAQLRLARLQADPRLLGPTHHVLDFMRNRDGMTITGACGDHECWHNTQEGTINLGETCATAYALLWLDELMRREGNSLYGDLMERVIFNTLFGAQSADGRRLRYYTAFDGPRHYFEKDSYCCPNNYRRAIATLPDLVYYRVGEGLAVNLYSASSLEAKLEGGATLKLRQETDYPSGSQVALSVEPSHAARFPLWLRIPAWCRHASLSINGQPSGPAAASGRFLVVNREWKAGDQVTLDLPMPARWVKGRRMQAGRVALLRGPQLFCLNRARHAELKDLDLRLVVFDPSTLEGPISDDSVRPGGKAFRAKAWKPGVWYPHAKPDFTLTLTEFPDPDGEATYFKVPNPEDPHFVADELLMEKS
jgi:hypothetical protein